MANWMMTLFGKKADKPPLELRSENPAPSSVSAPSMATVAVAPPRSAITVGEVAERWLYQLQHRKRRPAKPATLATFQSFVNRITPCIGDLAVESVSNATLRDLAAYLSSEDLSPKTIQEMLAAVKAIVASVVDPSTGDCLYPRTWNAEFIDAPTIEKQNQPIVTTLELQEALAHAAASEQDRVLWALASGSGARIGELLSIRIGSSDVVSCWNPDDVSVTIRTAMFNGVEQPPKTRNSLRTIEIAESLNEFLKAFVGRRSSGFLFTSADGHVANVGTLRDHLDQVLPNRGFHSLRRYRATHLASQNCPTAIARFWLGHASSDVHEKYNHLAENAALRREWAQKIGLGFALA